MDIAFDKNEWVPGAVPASLLGTCGQPDWHGLHARLWAARQVWQVLGRGRKGGATGRTGSFNDAAAARLIAMAARSGAINQTDAGNRNRGWTTIGADAGSSSTGGRE